MIRVGIVDDHQIFRKSLRALVDSLDGTEVVLDAGDGNELLELLKTKTIDLLLLDIQMPGMNGYTTCSIVRKEYPDIKVLILSQLNSKEAIHKVMEVGAHGFFTKNANPEELENAILSIKEREYYFGQELRGALREALDWDTKQLIKKVGSPKLSEREMEIIKMACKEHKNDAIAHALCISILTVESHRKKILQKTDSKNFLGVLVFALRNGLLTIEDL